MRSGVYQYPLTYFANTCGKDTLTSVPGDDEMECPLISPRGRSKGERRCLISPLTGSLDLYLSKGWGVPTSHKFSSEGWWILGLLNGETSMNGPDGADSDKKG